MANLSALYQDPQFQSLDEDKKYNVITGIVGKDPGFQKLPDDRKAYVLNGIMAAGRKQWQPKAEQKQESLGKNIVGSAATIADQAAGLVVGGAQAAGQAFGWAKNKLMGKPQAAQEAVSAVAPLDHLQGGYSKLVDAAFGEGTSAGSTVGHFFGQVGQKIQQGQDKYAGKDPEKQAQAKVVTDFAMNYMLPHALGLAGKAIGKVTGAKVEVPPVDHADLKAKLNQLAPDMPAEQVDHIVKTVEKSAPELDKHINAETKAHDLMQRGASKKEVEAVIKKNPLVGQKMEEIRQRRAEAIGGLKEEGPKTGEVLPPEGAPKPPESLQLPSSTSGEPTIPPQIESGVKRIGKGQSGAADPELLAKMGLTAGGALTGYLLAGQNKQDKPAGALLGALVGFMGARAATGGMKDAVSAMGDNWRNTLASGITSAGAVGMGAYLDEEDRLEGALFGAAFAASRNMPKAKHLSEEELVASYHDGLVAHDRIVGNVVSAVKQYIPDETARKAFYEKLHRKDFSSMTAGEKEVANTWKNLQVQYGEMAKEAGVIKGFIEDYVPRIASKMGMPESEVQRILAEIVPERTNVSGSTKTKFSKSRTQDTFDDFLRAAKEKGLDVSNVDFADVMGNYLRSMNKAVQGAKLIKTLEQAKGKDGTLSNLIVGAEKAPSDYRSVNNPQLRGKRVHPEIADALEIVMGGKNHHDVTNAALAVTSALKRMNVVGSFFHAKSLIEAHLLSGKNPLDIKGIKSALDAFRNGGAGDTIDKLIRSGLMVGLPDDAPVGSFGKMGELLDHAINRSLGTGVKSFGKVFTAAEKAQIATFDRVTWDFLHTGFKLSAAMREMELYRTGKKYQGMSEQEAMKGISSAINDTYGGINWSRAHQEAQTVVGRKLMSLISTPNGRDMMGLLVFAPDWTLSTLRMFSKSLPGGTANKANAALSRKYVRNSIIAYLTAINLANIAFSGHPIWDNKKDKTKVELPDGTSMQLMKHSMEPYEAITHPTKFITNKLGAPVKIAGLAITGSTSFNPMYPADSKIGAAIQTVSPFTVNPFTDPNVSASEALMRSAAGTLGVGIYGTSNAMKQTEEYKKRQRERYARMHGRVPKQQ